MIVEVKGWRDGPMTAGVPAWAIPNSKTKSAPQGARFVTYCFKVRSNSFRMRRYWSNQLSGCV